ncbi:hypothetical protein Scep_020889 [Stephania cephalantha]|uniref:Peptidase C1A papain C-terminal domain-containing protein n=1 Tax=Stephania cephalantha TaxID=152367 RepID=A0AAP0F529_9MAGN
MAFRYVVSNEGLTTDEDYPYKAKNGTCDAQKLQKRCSLRALFRNGVRFFMDGIVKVDGDWSTLPRFSPLELAVQRAETFMGALAKPVLLLLRRPLMATEIGYVSHVRVTDSRQIEGMLVDPLQIVRFDIFVCDGVSSRSDAA